MRADDSVSDLSRFLSRARWSAEPGADGAAGRKTGRRGADLTIEVPVGTVAQETEGGVIADLTHPGDESVVATGGAGGRGNVHFKSPSRQAPDFAERGLKGERKLLTLDLKLIADIGLVGPPNAGKSSLLRAITSARPKVGAYPFTTLDPELGVVETSVGRMVVADIPGLIEGASGGAGLGLRFLRHVERTRVLVYVLDGSAPDPWSDLAMVRREVEQYSAPLLQRPAIVVVNKVDLEATRRLRSLTRRRNVMFVSALTGEGIEALVGSMSHRLGEAGRSEPSETSPKAIKLPTTRASAPVVERLRGGFRVRGGAVERLVERTDLDSDSALARFQTALDRLGVNAALEAAGAQAGDSVRIAGLEFEYQP